MPLRSSAGNAYTLLPHDSGIEIGEWRFTRVKAPIAPSTELDEFQRRTGVHCPEMSFLSNRLCILHKPSGVRVIFDAGRGLEGCKHGSSEEGTSIDQSNETDKSQNDAASASAAAAAASSSPSPSPAPAASSSTATVRPRPQSNLQVSAASNWAGKSFDNLIEGGLKKVEFGFDWTYTTRYKGDVLQGDPVTGSSSDSNAAADTTIPPPSTLPLASHRLTPTQEAINISLLQRPDPILWYDSLPLFEDELHDNGVSSLTVRVRVMDSCWLVLLQFWLRVDDKVLRVYDTRYYAETISSGNNGQPQQLPRIIREQTIREDSFEELSKRGMPRTASLYTDPMVVARKLTLHSTQREKIDLTTEKRAAAEDTKDQATR